MSEEIRAILYHVMHKVNPTMKINNRKTEIDITKINELMEEIDLCIELLGYEKEMLERMEDDI